MEMFWPPVFVTQTAGNNNLKGRKKNNKENKLLFLIFSAKNPKRNTGYSTDAKLDSLDAQKSLWVQEREVEEEQKDPRSHRHILDQERLH